MSVINVVEVIAHAANQAGVKIPSLTEQILNWALRQDGFNMQRMLNLSEARKPKTGRPVDPVKARRQAAALLAKAETAEIRASNGTKELRQTVILDANGRPLTPAQVKETLKNWGL